MTYSRLKQYKNSLVIFLIFSQLMGSGCKKNGPVVGGTGRDSINTPDGGSSGVANLGVGNSGGSSASVANPAVGSLGGGNVNTGGQVITKQRIQELLDKLRSHALLAGDAQLHLIPFLKDIKKNRDISEFNSRKYLRYAIAYGNDDIVTLAVDSLKGDIHTAYDYRTLLEWADYYHNNHAKKLLIQKGAKY
jgi:hypothetical protein